MHDQMRRKPIQLPPVSGPGSPLEPGLRARLEGRFARRLEDVRVHTGPAAFEAASALGARAFTSGRDIVMGDDATDGDRDELLAHEVAHVVQTDGAQASSPRVSDPDGPHERSARAAASNVVAGRDAGELGRAEAGIHLQPKAQKPVLMPEVKKRIAAKGRPDITELAKALPNVFGAGPQPVRTITIGADRHVFQVLLDLTQGSPGPLGTANAATGESVKTTGKPGAQTVTHTLVIHMFTTTVGDAVETLFHELVHARILMDKSLPESERGQTYREYAQLVEMASDPALLIATGAAPKKKAVFDGIAMLRGATSMVPGFDASKLGADQSPDRLYEFLINEKFANSLASATFGSALPNTTIGARYVPAVRRNFEEAIQAQNLWQAYTTGSGKTPQDFMDVAAASLTTAVVALYDALDAEHAAIEQFKKQPLPKTTPVVPGVNAPFQPGYDMPPPVDIGGKIINE